MICKVIVASACILVDFKEKVGGLQDVSVFLNGHIAYDR
jgi:hypothetical protein